MKWTLRIGVPLVVFLALLYPSRYAEMLAMRELFRAAVATGLIEDSGRLWGQILRYNIPSHPDWLHRLVEIVAASVAFAPALVISLALYHRLTFGRHFFDRTTRCGHCGAPMKGLREARCPACGREF